MAIRKVIPRSLDSAAASANLSFDANTFFVDSTNNAVGIGTSSPSTYGKFVVAGGDGNTQFNVGTSGVLRVAGYNSAFSGALLESVNTAQSAYLPITIDGSYAVVATGGTERMRIDNNGNLMIGTSANANVFDAVGATRPLIVARSDTNTSNIGSLAAIAIHNSDTTTNNVSQLNFTASTGASTNLYSSGIISVIHGARTNSQYPTGIMCFSTSTAVNNAPSEKMRIDNNGLITLATGQIKFPATQVASTDANTLDDYEEGTWTPATTPSTSGTVTLKNINARYTKVGRLINVWFSAQVNTISSPLGRLGLSGLPFSTTGTPIGAVALINGFTTFTGSTGALIESSTTANIDRYNAGSIVSDLASYAAANGYIFFSATYDTSS